MNRPRIHLLATTLLAAAAFSSTPHAALAAPASVRVVQPKPAAEARAYVAPGRAEPAESATLFTRATGVVRERRADIGDRVSAGDVLAVIDAPDLDRAIEAARAQVDQAKARAENARVMAERARSLFGTQATSREEYEERASQAAELEAGVRVAQAELARLEELKGFTSVRAPFDGVVAARNFDRGDRVRGDSATADGWLYRLVRVNELRFAIAAAPDLALRLTPDQEVQVRFAEFPGRAFTARVARTSRAFDTASGTMRIELALPNPELAIPAGLTGTAHFQLSGTAQTLLVPTNTLVTRSGRSFVAAVREGRVAMLPVIPGRNLGQTVEVVAPALNAETPVILNPNALLNDGDPVEVKAAGA